MSSPAAKPPLLERVGVTYFERRSSKKPVPASVDAIHFLNPEERKAVNRVVRTTIARACVAGALSAAASAVAEVWATPLAPEGTPLFSMGSLQFWAALLGVTVIASVLEILFLYWDTLRSVHELSTAAGLELFGKTATEQDRAVAQALARAALELPNPISGPWRVDPRREASKAMLLVASIAYKAKVGVTNFIVKMLVRRILGRTVLRAVANTLLPFVAVPITALWNGVVAWQLLKEARLRVMGPSAAIELVDVVFGDAPPLTEEGRLAAVRAVAAAIVRTQDLHPNLLALLHEVQQRAGDTGNAELDDPGEFLRQLKSLAAGEQKLALQTLAVACVVDGRLARREVKLLQEAFTVVGKSIDMTGVERLRVAFVRGDGVADDAVRAI